MNVALAKEAKITVFCNNNISVCLISKEEFDELYFGMDDISLSLFRTYLYSS